MKLIDIPHDIINIILKYVNIDNDDLYLQMMIFFRVQYSNKLINLDKIDIENKLYLKKCVITKVKFNYNEQIFELINQNKIKTLIVSNLFVDNIFSYQLINFNNLTKLIIKNLFIPQEQYLQIKKMVNLEKLNLVNNTQLLIPNSFFENMTRLKKLSLAYNGVIDKNYLSNLSNLKKLNLKRCSFSNVDFTNLPKLECLNMKCSMTMDYNEINQIKTLRKICIDHTSLQYFSNFHSLRYLDLRVKASDFFKIKLFHQYYNIIAKFETVDKLNLSGFDIDCKDLSILTKITNLKLNYCKLVNEKYLGKSTQLKSLSLKKVNINNFNFLNNLVNLTKLDIRENELSKKSIQFIKNIKIVKHHIYDHNV